MQPLGGRENKIRFLQDNEEEGWGWGEGRRDEEGGCRDGGGGEGGAHLARKNEATEKKKCKNYSRKDNWGRIELKK